MQRKKQGSERNWREWLETRPLVVLVGAAVAVSSTTLAVTKYFFDQERKIAEQSRAAELQQAKSDLAAKIKELEGRLLSIERHVGTETIWDLNTVLVSPRQVKALGSDFTYFDDLQVYLSVPKSEAWTFKQMNEMEFGGMVYGSKWLKDQLATPLGRMMSETKISCWRGPDAFEIVTTDPQVPLLHVFPYVSIERVNNQKLLQYMGKFIDEQEREAKQKAVDEAKGTLDQKRDQKLPIDTVAASPSATETGSADTEGETHESSRLSKVEAKKEALNRLVNADIVSFFLLSSIMDGYHEAARVKKGASFRVLNAEKEGNVFYVHAQIVVPASGTRPKVYLDNEIICISDSEDMVAIQTLAPSTDQRPPEAAWINSWLAGLRVVLR
ncbi:MAG TPA: hypothetical protein VFU37_12285 [Pyrinomonadaceae bacterium]|nr:hypothetical protein [Pyrinomonadaceae bacterium]